MFIYKYSLGCMLALMMNYGQCDVMVGDSLASFYNASEVCFKLSLLL